MERPILAQKILDRLKVYYPKPFHFYSEEQSRIFIEDFCRTFQLYSDETLLNAYRKWHENKSFAPTTADILALCRSMQDIEVKEPEFELIEIDGKTYARRVN